MVGIPHVNYVELICHDYYGHTHTPSSNEGGGLLCMMSFKRYATNIQGRDMLQTYRICQQNAYTLVMDVSIKAEVDWPVFQLADGKVLDGSTSFCEVDPLKHKNCLKCAIH